MVQHVATHERARIADQMNVLETIVGLADKSLRPFDPLRCVDEHLRTLPSSSEVVEDLAIDGLGRDSFQTFHRRTIGRRVAKMAETDFARLASSLDHAAQLA